jgi:ankyrin repeat protein
VRKLLFVTSCLVVQLTTGVRVSATGDVRLIEAVKSRNIPAVRALLNQRADVNTPQGDGATALHWAVHLNDLATADLLIRAGARANAANDTGVTPLYLACTNRNAAMVERLLAADANPNATLVNGETALMKCAHAGEAGAVKALLSRGASVNAKEPSHDQTALMWAAAEQHSDVVKLLVESGADVRARSRVYAQTVTSEVTQRAGREELNYTVLRGGSTPLLFAARVGDVDSMELLLAAGADANDALPNGASALVVAAHSGQGAVGALLLDRGADPNAATVGYTALHAAVLRGDLKLVRALLTHGANPNARITKGTPVRRNSQDFELPATLIGATPYVLAAKFLEVDIMRVLLAGDADPRSKMKDGTTALMAAAGMGAVGRADRPADRRGLGVVDGGKLEDVGRVLEAVTVALNAGGDVNAVTQTGETALHSAASLGYDPVVQFLADNGAELNVRNTRGRTPLAALRGRDQGAGAVDPSGENAPKSTVDLLRKLGGVE